MTEESKPYFSVPTTAWDSGWSTGNTYVLPEKTMEKILVTFSITDTYSVVLDKDRYVDEDGFVQEELLEEFCYDSAKNRVAELENTEFSLVASSSHVIWEYINGTGK